MPGPYEIYLIRHAVAEERSDAWPDDTKRPLTDNGISRMRKGARGLVRMGVTIDVILSSPLVRTRQTAELIAAAFDARPPIVTVESLQPGGSYQSVLNDLEKQSRRSRIGLVGHEPDIGHLAAQFIGSRQPIPFKKGAICRIDLETLPPSGHGTLRWFMTTKILGMLRK